MSIFHHLVYLELAQFIIYIICQLYLNKAGETRYHFGKIIFIFSLRKGCNSTVQSIAYKFDVSTVITFQWLPAAAAFAVLTRHSHLTAALFVSEPQRHNFTWFCLANNLLAKSLRSLLISNQREIFHFYPELCYSRSLSGFLRFILQALCFSLADAHLSLT